jgi:uncharacterized protein
MTLSQNVSWNEIESLVTKLSENILKLSRSFTSITTISRGGLIPSRLLSDILGIKIILVDQDVVSSDSLFVDDIFDTGTTFSNVFSTVNDPSKFVFATLFARRGMNYPEQLLYAEKTFDDSYVVFPWDKLEYETSLSQSELFSKDNQILDSIRKKMINSKNEYDIFKKKTGDSDLVFNARDSC